MHCDTGRADDRGRLPTGEDEDNERTAGRGDGSHAPPGRVRV